MSLRIFEPRYVRMVKESLKAQQGFGVCMLNSKGDKELNQHIYPVGTYAKVIDFDMLDDGLLGITVEGEFLFSIDSIETEHDELRVGNVHRIDAWHAETFPDCEATALQERLVQIIASYPELHALYSEPPVSDMSWVVYRWLELLPIKAADKQQLLEQEDPKVVVDFLASLIE
ncbi:peptidase S16 [Planctobacterium marinum]|uniref:Peptidase S16 n=2 Tax=Planctobacterium marinum TaxID=1631968 RepID=A0AA48HSN2_9ALTE|nr:peptidase S16 [Planctobacterium marinum]